MALLFVAGMACVAAGLAGRRAADAAESLTSLRHNAKVTIGGEVMTDIAYRRDSANGTAKSIELRRADLRIVADVHPNVRGFFKLDLSDGGDYERDRQILDEAMLVASSLGGTGFGAFVGQGRAPYGQDITLGMIQSYHHRADRVDSPEGRIYIIDPPRDAFVSPLAPRADLAPPPPRPGQMDRAVMAGVSYDWDDRWRVEAAVFDPDDAGEWLRLRGAAPAFDTRNDLGVAARVWWRPVETLTLEASAMRLHSSESGERENRIDLPPFAQTRGDAWSMSLGFDWRMGPWRVFGEFQRAWDWGFVKDYDVTIGQLGASREFLDVWRLGTMAECMRASDPLGRGIEDTYFKFVLNLRYSLSDGAFVMLEYGHETMRRDMRGTLREKRRGDFLGARMGLQF